MLQLFSYIYTLFSAELLGISQKFSKIFQLLKDTLIEEQDNKISTWNILATLELYPKLKDERSAAQKFHNCAEILKQSMKKLPNAEMLEHSLKLLEEISDKNPDLTNMCAEEALELLILGEKTQILNQNQSSLLKEFSE